MTDLRERTIRLAHENPELRPHLLPILKKAGFGKTAGYTHYWDLLNRSESVNLNIEKNLRTQIMKGLKMTMQMVKQGEAFQRMNPSSSFSWRQERLSLPSNLNHRALDEAMKLRGGYGSAALPEWFRQQAAHFSDWADELTRVEEKELARRCKTMAKNLEKVAGQMEKSYKIFRKHEGAYKPNQKAWANNYFKYANLADTALKAMLQMLPMLEDMDEGEASDGEFGFTDDEWKKVLAGAKKIIAAFEKDPEPWGTAGVYRNFDYEKYSRLMDEQREKGGSPGYDPELAEAAYDEAPKGPFKIMGPNGTGKPQLDNKKIALNGEEKSDVGDLAHETFWLDKNAPKDKAWSFCKTERKPYDAVVVSILAMAKKVAPKAISISSDGGRSALKKLY
jgi:hypothetical protein